MTKGKLFSGVQGSAASSKSELAVFSTVQITYAIAAVFFMRILHQTDVELTYPCAQQASP